MAAWGGATGGRVGAAVAVAIALASALIGGPAVAAAAQGTAVQGTAVQAAVAKPSAAAQPSGPPWYFASFDMGDVWKITSGGQVVVGVVAGGVGSPGEVLQNALIPGGDVSSDGGGGSTGDVLTAYDGTQVAALIAAKSTSPAAGMAPGASILPVRDIARGEQMSDSAETARGIEYAADHGASVILVVDTAPRMDHEVGTAVADALGKDALVIAPSGNTGQSGNNVNAMCSFDGVVCVGATSKDGAHWPNSASGAKVDLAAPGVQVTVPTPSGATRLGSSTHYSAALVAAEAALIRSAHPTWSAGQVVRVMIENTTGGKPDHSRVGDQVGYGVISPLAAVRAPAPSSTADPLSTASPHPSTAPSAPHQSKTPAVSAGSSGGSGSGTLLLIAGAAVGGLVVIGLVLWLMLRNRGRGGNYLTDPGYGAGYYYEQDSGPTSQLGGYQGRNAEPPPYQPEQPPPQQPPRTAPQPFQYEQTPPPYWPSQPMQRPQPPSEPSQQPPQQAPQRPASESEPEPGAGYTQSFAGEPLPEPGERPQDPEPPEDDS